MTAPQTFTPSYGLQSVTVPADASVARIECWGAQGLTNGGAGGLGGYSKGDLAVTPGDVLYVNAGDLCGASDVRVSSDLAGRRIVAGGGGEGGQTYDFNTASSSPTQGGNGGGLVGGGGVRGGTQTAGGQGVVRTDSEGYPGRLGYGGQTTGSYRSAAYHGGRGGDGYYGGGAEAYDTSGDGNTVYCYPGGGGSGFVGGVLGGIMSTGVQSGDGQVVITWVNTAPLAPTLTTPATGMYTLVPPTLAWTFADPDVGDTQTSADVRYRLSGGSTWTTLTAAATTASTYTFSAGVITTGSAWEWQVRTYDVTGTVGPWSASSFFNAVAVPPAPTITAPASGATLLDTPTTVTWTLPSGGAQTAMQVQRCSDAVGTVVYYDSGQVATAALTITVPLDLVYGRTDVFRVRYLNAVWSAWGTVSAITYAGPPQAPLVTCTPDPITASVLVRIINPPQTAGYASAVSNDLSRTSPDGTTVRLATGLAPGAELLDGLPGAGVNEYKATAYASNGATALSY